MHTLVICWFRTCFTSGSQHFLHHVTRHVVEEESQDGQQQESSDNLDGQPPVLVTHQVFHSFKRDEEPEEGDIWTAGGAEMEADVKEVEASQQSKNNDLQTRHKRWRFPHTDTA